MECISWMFAVLVSVTLVCGKPFSKTRWRPRGSCPMKFYYVETMQLCCPCSQCPRSSIDYVVLECYGHYERNVITDINSICESHERSSCCFINDCHEFHHQIAKNATDAVAKSITPKITTRHPTTASTTTQPKTLTRETVSAATITNIIATEVTTPIPGRYNTSQVVTISPGVAANESNGHFFKTLALTALGVLLVVAVSICCLLACKKTRKFADKCGCQPEQTTSEQSAVFTRPIETVEMTSLLRPRDRREEEEVQQRMTETQPASPLPPKEMSKPDPSITTSKTGDQLTMTHESECHGSATNEHVNEAQPTYDDPPSQPPRATSTQAGPINIHGNRNIIVILPQNAILNVETEEIPLRHQTDSDSSGGRITPDSFHSPDFSSDSDSTDACGCTSTEALVGTTNLHTIPMSNHDSTQNDPASKTQYCSKYSPRYCSDQTSTQVQTELLESRHMMSPFPVEVEDEEEEDHIDSNSETHRS